MKDLLYTIAAIPALALVGGFGILAYRIGETWNSATTQSLVTGLTVVCGGGALLFAILLACIVGIPLAIRAYGEGGASRRAWTNDDDGWGNPMRISSSRNDDWSAVSSKRQPSLIDGQWQRMSEPAPAQPSSTPPWGMTGGGNTQLLPPVKQDERFGVE